MSKTESNNDHKLNQSGNDSAKVRKKQYQAPQILSSEKLEAAAVVCDPPVVGGFGKIVGGLGTCGTLGS